MNLVFSESAIFGVRLSIDLALVLYSLKLFASVVAEMGNRGMFSDVVLLGCEIHLFLPDTVVQNMTLTFFEPIAYTDN